MILTFPLIKKIALYEREESKLNLGTIYRNILLGKILQEKRT
jgi:hypothetical protein